MSYGSKQWQDWVLDEDEALPLIEHAYKSGINTWDTVSTSTICMCVIDINIITPYRPTSTPTAARKRFSAKL